MGSGPQTGERFYGPSFLTKVNGTRIHEMDISSVPHGWVVDARQNDPLWEYMHIETIPLKPQEVRINLNSVNAIKASAQLKKWQKELNDPEAFVVMVQHSDTGWWSRAVRPADLKRDNPQVLLNEALDAIGEGKYILADALETAYRARTGEYDLH